MADGNDVLIALWEDQREAERQTANQRATLTNIIILVVAAGLGFIANTGLQTSMLVVTLSMSALGFYGVLACLTFYERCEFHVGQAEGLRKKIAKQFPALDIEAGLAETCCAHHASFRPRRTIRKHVLWVLLHAAIAVAGAALSGWIIFS
ncbi:hypothetical protein [Streptomyces sp. NPDC001816]|uniref:hypothetical protein n=1 Tax=Streptomyces sp. NPDC001816 TaxID=3364612 RepID=UPI00368B28E2